jgi:hypothetical protein
MDATYERYRNLGLSGFDLTFYYSKLTAVTRHASAAARWCIIVIRVGHFF